MIFLFFGNLWIYVVITFVPLMLGVYTFPLRIYESVYWFVSNDFGCLYLFVYVWIWFWNLDMDSACDELGYDSHGGGWRELGTKIQNGRRNLSL